MSSKMAANISKTCVLQDNKLKCAQKYKTRHFPLLVLMAVYRFALIGKDLATFRGLLTFSVLKVDLTRSHS